MANLQLRVGTDDYSLAREFLFFWKYYAWEFFPRK